MKSKKYLIILIALIFLVGVVVGGFVFIKNRKQTTITLPTKGVKEESNYCTQEPYISETGIGGYYYPVNSKYGELKWLGQLFTADDCGGERIKGLMMVDGDNYTFGSAIWLKDNPSISLINTLKSIGFVCEESTNEDTCKKWILDKVAKTKELLKLKPYYNQLLNDDCRICG